MEVLTILCPHVTYTHTGQCLAVENLQLRSVWSCYYFWQSSLVLIFHNTRTWLMLQTSQNK